MDLDEVEEKTGVVDDDNLAIDIKRNVGVNLDNDSNIFRFNTGTEREYNTGIPTNYEVQGSTGVTEVTSGNNGKIIGNALNPIQANIDFPDVLTAIVNHLVLM